MRACYSAQRAVHAAVTHTRIRVSRLRDSIHTEMSIGLYCTPDQSFSQNALSHYGDRVNFSSLRKF